jgi:hypothetical protein
MKQVASYPVMLHKKNLELENTRGIDFLLIVLVICTLPLERILLPASLKIVDVPLVLLVAYGGIKLINRNQGIHVPLIWPIWLTLIASLIATMTGLLSLNSIVAMIQEVYLFLWFIVLTNILISYSQFEFDTLIKIWSLVAILEATTAIMGMMNIGPAIFYTSPLKGNILSTGEFNRAFGTFANPNATGTYLSISFFMLLAVSNWKRLTRLILGLFLLVGIYSTGSMGAVLSTIASFLILIVIRPVYKNQRAALLTGGIVALGIAMLIILILVYNPSQSLRSIIETSDRNAFLSLTLGRLFHSVTGRVNLIEDVWHFYYRHPLGIGPDAATLISGTLHNDYVAYLFERGPFGLIAWLWLVIATLITPLRMKDRYSANFRFWQLLVLWSGFLAIILNAFSHEISHFRQVWMLMAFLYSAYYGLSNRNDEIPVIPKQKDPAGAEGGIYE